MIDIDTHTYLIYRKKKKMQQKEKGFLKLIQKFLRYKEIFLYATNMIRITGA